MRLFSSLASAFRHQEFVIVAMILAVILWQYPLQKLITLARFQHYGLAVLVWSFGFFVQAVWSWKVLGNYSRTVLCLTGGYLFCFGTVLYSNPWLDGSISLQTQEQQFLRGAYTLACIGGGLLLTVVWWLWAGDLKTRDKPGEKADG